MALNVEGSSSSSDAVFVPSHVRMTSLVSVSAAKFIPLDMDLAALLDTRRTCAVGSRSTSRFIRSVDFC